MLPDRVSNPGPLTYESGALPIALRGPAKMCFNMERSKGIFVRENPENSIVNENAFNSEGSLMHYQVRPSNYSFQLFLTL